MMTKDQPAVIILNYKSFGDTLGLINSIEEYDPGLCIIVVDNASGAEDRQKLSDLKSRCITILLEENGGYAAGNNIGIRKAEELGFDTFLLANCDTRLIGRHAISDCYAYMKKNSIGILGPRMINKLGEDVSGIIHVGRYGGTRHQFTDKITECRSLTGAFLFIGKQVIDRIGYLREFYFLYREDTDYCLRAYNEGVKVVFYPKVTVVHKTGATTKDVAEYYYYRNCFILSREIYKCKSAELALFYIFRFIRYSLGIMRRKAPLSEKTERLKRLWNAYFDGVRDVRGKMIYG